MDYVLNKQIGERVREKKNTLIIHGKNFRKRLEFHRSSLPKWKAAKRVCPHLHCIKYAQGLMSVYWGKIPRLSGETFRSTFCG